MKTDMSDNTCKASHMPGEQGVSRYVWQTRVRLPPRALYIGELRQLGSSGSVRWLAIGSHVIYRRHVASVLKYLSPKLTWDLDVFLCHFYVLSYFFVKMSSFVACGCEGKLLLIFPRDVKRRKILEIKVGRKKMGSSKQLVSLSNK